MRSIRVSHQGWNGRCPGRAAWLDKQQHRCLILWKSRPEWAAVIADWAGDIGHIDSVVALEDLSSGDDVADTGHFFIPAPFSWSDA